MWEIIKSAKVVCDCSDTNRVGVLVAGKVHEIAGNNSNSNSNNSSNSNSNNVPSVSSWDDLGKVEKTGLVKEKTLLFEHTFEENGPVPMGRAIDYSFTLPVDENGNPYPTMDFILSINGMEQEITAEYYAPGGPGYPRYNVETETLKFDVLYVYGNQFEVVEATVKVNGTFEVALYHAEIVEETVEEIIPISEEYLPKAAAVADVTAAPTAAEFNALLSALRNAGYLATE